MEKLKVRFGKPQNGWIDVRISDCFNEISLNISYTPSHLIEELIEAIIKVLDDESAKANGSFNPERYEFIFKTENNIVHFQVKSFPDYRSMEGLSEVLFEFTGNNREVCKAFWRGLKDLEGKCSAETYKQVFRRDLPSRNLEFLTNRISERKFS